MRGGATSLVRGWWRRGWRGLLHAALAVLWVTYAISWLSGRTGVAGECARIASSPHLPMDAGDCDRPIRLHVGLASVPGREHLVPRVIESLLAQTRLPDTVVVSIPKRFSRFPNAVYDLTRLQPYVDRGQIVVNEVDGDPGPILKYHGPQGVASGTCGDWVVAVDDDLLYKARLLERISDAIEERGRSGRTAFSFAAWDIWPDTHGPGPGAEFTFGQEVPGAVTLGQGADSFAIRWDVLEGLQSTYRAITCAVPAAFLHDDLIVSVHLRVHGVRVVTLESQEGAYDFIPSNVFIPGGEHSGGFNGGLVLLQGSQHRDMITWNTFRAVRYLYPRVFGHVWLCYGGALCLLEWEVWASALVIVTLAAFYAAWRDHGRTASRIARGFGGIVTGISTHHQGGVQVVG